jgi:hypothetical protein
MDLCSAHLWEAMEEVFGECRRTVLYRAGKAAGASQFAKLLEHREVECDLSDAAAWVMPVRAAAAAFFVWSSPALASVLAPAAADLAAAPTFEKNCSIAAERAMPAAGAAKWRQRRAPPATLDRVSRLGALLSIARGIMPSRLQGKSRGILQQAERGSWGWKSSGAQQASMKCSADEAAAGSERERERGA